MSGVSWLAPTALWIAGAAALATIAAHYVSWRRPRDVMLPTARFVPVDQPPAAARTRAPSDLALLAVRLLLIALLGAAAAGPVVRATAGSVRRIVVLDRSAAVAGVTPGTEPGAARDSAARWLRADAGDVLLVADSAVRRADTAQLATVPRDRGGAARITAAGMPLSAVLVAASREAVRMQADADSFALVIVGAVERARTDAATDSVRALWPGRIELVRVAGPDDDPVAARAETRVELSAEADDPLRVALIASDVDPSASAGTRGERAGRPERVEQHVRVVRVVRGALTAADSSLARAGATVVHWPRGRSALALPARTRADSAGALVVDERVAIAPFRRAQQPPAGAAVAYWVDGVPAATERAVASGCIRTVAVEVPEAGDLPLRAPFQRVAAALVRPCGPAARAPLGAAAMAALRGSGGLAPAAAFAGDGAEVRSTIAPWLWGAALLVAVALLAWETALEPRRRAPREVPAERRELAA